MTAPTARRPRYLDGCCPVALVLTAFACSAEGGDGRSLATRDSAGVIITENAGPVWAEGDAWKLGPQPTIDLGDDEADPTEQFGTIRSLFRLPDGGLVIANFANPPEIRFYHVDGEHRRTIGGSGQGPGEFSAIFWIHFLEPDTIVAYDPTRRRLTYFDVAGELLATINTTGLADARSTVRYLLWAPLGDGWYLRIRNRVYEATQRGVNRDSILWTRARGDGSVIDTIGRFPGFEYYSAGTGRGESAALTFGLRWVVLGHDGAFYVAAGDEFRIDKYALDGTLEMSIRREYQRRPVTAADVDAMRQKELDAARTENGRRSVERRYRDFPHAEEMPAHGSHMIVDVEGNLWVEEYLGPRDSMPIYSVFTSAGRYLGDVTMPSRFQPHDIGADYVLGVWRDELDVEHAQLYALVKP